MIVIILNPTKLCYVLFTFMKSLKSSCQKPIIYHIVHLSTIFKKKLAQGPFVLHVEHKPTFFPKLAIHPCSFHSYLQFSSCIEFLQAIYSFLPVHHRGNSRTLLKGEDKNHFNALKQTSSILFTLQHTYYNLHGPKLGPLISTLSDYLFVQVATHLGNFQINKSKASCYSAFSTCKILLKETGTKKNTKSQNLGYAV